MGSFAVQRLLTVVEPHHAWQGIRVVVLILFTFLVALFGSYVWYDRRVILPRTKEMISASKVEVLEAVGQVKLEVSQVKLEVSQFRLEVSQVRLELSQFKTEVREDASRRHLEVMGAMRSTNRS